MNTNTLLIAAVVVVGYLVFVRKPTPVTASNSTGNAQQVGTSLDTLINDFTHLLDSVGKAVAGSGSGSASNSTETI